MLCKKITVVLVFTLVSFANSTLAKESVDELFVVATRLPTQIKDLPNHVTIISSEELQRYPAKTLPEILTLKAGLLSRSSFGNNAARSVIDIRGFGATGTQNTLILLDDKRLNDIDQSAINYSALPIENIERIEIVRGAGGVLYGDGAVGGVINIITKRTPDNIRQFSVQQRYASYNTWQTDASARYGSGRFSMNLFANTLFSDGYRDNNDLDQHNLQADLRYDAGITEVYSKFGFSDQKLGLPGNRTVDIAAGLDELNDDRRGTNNPDDVAEEQIYFATLGVQGDLSNAWEYIFDAGIRHKTQLSDLPSQPRYIDTELETLFFTPRFNADLGNGNIQHSLTFGLDLYYYQYESSIANSLLDQAQPIHILDISQNSYAVYLNDLMAINDKTHINLGARYQYIELEANDIFDPTAPGAAFDAEAADVERSENEYFFNIGLKQYFTDSVSAYVNWGQSVRFANVDDINQVSFPPPTFAAAREFTNLKPQRSRHVDVGVQYQSNRNSVSLNIYYTSLRNEIHFNPVSFSNVNLDPTERRGLEFSWRSDWTEKLSTSFHYSLIRSEFTEGSFAGNAVPLVPKRTFQITTEYRATPNLDVLASWNYVGEKFFDNDQDNDFGIDIPSYSLVDLGLNYRYKDVSLALGVNNILDKKAFDSGVSSTFTAGRYNALPLPERNYAIILQATF